jgi:uncharacterized membrane protein YgcG
MDARPRAPSITMWPFTKKKKPAPSRYSYPPSSHSSAPSTNNDLLMFNLGMMAGDSSPAHKPAPETHHDSGHSSHYDSGSHDSGGSYDSGSSDSGGGSDGGGGGGSD